MPPRRSDAPPGESGPPDDPVRPGHTAPQGGSAPLGGRGEAVNRPAERNAFLVANKRSLPAGLRPVSLLDLAHALQIDPSVTVRVIGPDTNPDALAVTMPKDRADRLSQAFADRLLIASDDALSLLDEPVDF